MSTGTVSQWMMSAQFLGLRKHSFILELAEVYFSPPFVGVSDIFSFSVLVVLIFTKFDALEIKCYSELREQGKRHEEASTQVPELANKTFQSEYLRRIQDVEFPPKTYVCLAGNILYSYTNFSSSHRS